MPDLTVSADIDAFMAAANDAAARTELGLTSLATTTPGTGVATALAVNIGSAGAPVLFNGAGGTPSSLVGTNITGTAAGLTAGTASAVAVGGITGLGTGVGAALAINVGSAGAPVVLNGAGGTPSSLVGTNITGTAAGLTAGAATAVAVSGITGLGADVGNLLATFSSANMLAALTTSTGTGVVVFGTNPTIDGPTLTNTTTAATMNVTTGNVTTFRVLDNVDQSHGMQFVIASNLTANRTLTLTTGDANRALTLTGDFAMSGAFNITLTATGNTNVTLPTTGTLATLAGAEAFTNKTLTSPTITTPSAFTTGGTITLAENTSIALDPAGSADGKWTGISVTGTAGYTQAFGDLVYLDPTDSRWEACDANSAAGADGDSRGLIGMVVSAGTDGTACTILLTGIIRADAKFPTFTVNNPIYVSETAAAVTQTQPTTTDVVIRLVGAALTADEMFFRPDFTYTTHT